MAMGVSHARIRKGSWPDREVKGEAIVTVSVLGLLSIAITHADTILLQVRVKSSDAIFSTYWKETRRRKEGENIITNRTHEY